MDVCDNISPGVTVAARADDHLRARPVDAAARSPPGIRMFRDEYLAHIREGRCPFPPTGCPGGWPVPEPAPASTLSEAEPRSRSACGRPPVTESAVGTPAAPPTAQRPVTITLDGRQVQARTAS